MPPHESWLIAVRRAATSNSASGALLREAIVAARTDGHSLRAIADAAGVTHPTVLKILREQGGA